MSGASVHLQGSSRIGDVDGALDRRAGLDLPLLWPRVLVVVGGSLVALLASLWIVAVVALGAGFMLVWIQINAGEHRSPLRSAGIVALMLVGGTLLLTPLWLVFLVGVAWGEAVRIAAALAVRLCGVFLVSYAFAAATPPMAWLASLRRFPRLALALSLTLRQVPEFTEDAVRLRAAQRGRGLLVGHRRWRPLVFLVPLFSRAIERADRLSMALVLAGWGEGRSRPVRVPRARWSDPVLVVTGLGLGVVALLPWIPL